MYNSTKQLRVVQILSESQLVLNAGANDGIEINDEFIIYGLGNKNIYDPETNENLGKLEIYRGTGRAIYVQEKMCILEALSPSALARMQTTLGGTSNAKFSNAAEKDYAKPNATRTPAKKQD